ncbi:hypothetical protein UA08_04659 [Talaromyces atroroseus]|uniref:Uncharacterized protein n=1 Tax=Talaromyces atroroseus TaxID=1441469 RepID=A0A225AGQ1_TALAT|nr:hypothetical protein UA08_04659 [Talaromyces atroroseus]OKL59880.1 hypothetical protein UA08_04659 [Talaromyces atroroseus]
MKENDVKRLTPRLFWYSDIAIEDDVIDAVEGECEFNRFFDDLFSYCTELEAQGVAKGCESNDTGLTSALRANETVTLPKVSWRVSKREQFRHFITSQGMKDARIHFTISGFELKPEGAVTVGPKNEHLPIISYTGWFKGQTWEPKANTADDDCYLATTQA